MPNSTRISGFALVLSVVASAISASAQSQPFAHTQPAAPIFATSATLNGMATPNGLDSIAWFEWGTNANYGQLTSPVGVGDGTNVVHISATAPGLVNGGIYQCRLVVSNAAGKIFGAPRLFTTGNKAAGWGDNYYTQSVPLAGVTVNGSAGPSTLLAMSLVNTLPEIWSPSSAPVLVSSMATMGSSTGSTVTCT